MSYDPLNRLTGAGGIGGLLARTDNTRLIVSDPFASAYYHCDVKGVSHNKVHFVVDGVRMSGCTNGLSRLRQRRQSI
jgi:hypothetical protein